MNKKAFLVVGAIATALLLGGCRTSSIYNVEDQPVIMSISYTLDDVREAIVRAGSRRGWTFKEEGEGKLIGTLYLRDHKAVVTVDYSKEIFDVTYRDSENLNYNAEQGIIHSNYNSWIKNLIGDINIELSSI